MRLVRTTSTSQTPESSDARSTRVTSCSGRGCNQDVIAAVLDRRAWLRRIVRREGLCTPLLGAVLCLPLRHVRNFLILRLDDVSGQPLHVRVLAIF